MSTAFFKAILSVLVVEVTLLLVGKTFVGLLNFLKLLFVATAIGVFL